MNNIFKKRYIVILIFFLIAIFFGRNIDPTPSEAERDQRIRVLTNRLSVPDNVVSINGDNNTAELFSSSFIEGRAYRLIYDAKAEPSQAESIYYKNIAAQDYLQRKTKIDFYLQSSLGQMQLVGSVELPLSNVFETHSLSFSAEINYDKLIVKTNFKEPDSISLRNCQLAVMPVGVEAKDKNLILSDQPQAIEADTKYLGLDQTVVSFNKRNLIGGEVFKAKSDNISYLELMPKIEGSGGYGLISIELRTANHENGRYIVGDLICSKNYDPQELYRFLRKDGTLRIKLVSKLDEGKYYFVGINNSLAGYNRFNYISLQGTKKSDNYKDGAAVILKNGKKISEKGDIYFNIFYAEDKIYNTKKILNGEYIEKFIDKGKYHFQLKKDPIDLLDVETISLADPSKDYVQFLDSLHSIVGTNSKGTFYVYKFETIYPIKKLNIKAQSIKDNYFATNIDYSLDSKSWQGLNEIEPNTYSETLSNNINTLYLKISGESQNVENSTKNYFGLSDLIIDADLNL